jgi:beta-galactosidase
VAAADEMLLKERTATAKRHVRGSLAFTETATRINVHGSNVDLVFDKDEGFVRSWMLREKNLVDPAFGIRPLFWRPPTDNDYGNGEPLRAQRYKQPFRPSSVEAQTLENGAVAITVRGSGVRAAEVWTLFPDGTLELLVETAPEKQKDVEIPRLGIRFRVKEDAFRYLGRGPVENYWDRCSGSFKRIWNSRASAEYYPYVRPQETGHHIGTDWLSIGPITVARVDEPFEFNALRHTVEDLDSEEAVGRPYQWNNFSPDEIHDDALARNRLRRQTHQDDVPERDFTEVCVDYRMTGVGGYDSWGSRPEPDCTLWSNESYRYRIRLVPGKPEKAMKEPF